MASTQSAARVHKRRCGTTRDTQHTYGYYRVEVLGALTNAVVLIGISIYVLAEAYERFRNPPPVANR